MKEREEADRLEITLLEAPRDQDSTLLKEGQHTRTDPSWCSKMRSTKMVPRKLELAKEGLINSNHKLNKGTVLCISQMFCCLHEKSKMIEVLIKFNYSRYF